MRVERGGDEHRQRLRRRLLRRAHLAHQGAALSRPSGEDSKPLPWWGWALFLLVGVGLAYGAYLDVRLDFVGVHGWAWVSSATISSGSGDYSYRKYCHLTVQVPKERLKEEPDAAPERNELCDAAAETEVSWREEPEVCYRYRHTWQRVFYDEQAPKHLRFGNDLGAVVKLALGVLAFGALWGIRVLVLRVPARRRRKS